MRRYLKKEKCKKIAGQWGLVDPLQKSTMSNLFQSRPTPSPTQHVIDQDLLIDWLATDSTNTSLKQTN